MVHQLRIQNFRLIFHFKNIYKNLPDSTHYDDMGLDTEHLHIMTYAKGFQARNAFNSKFIRNNKNKVFNKTMPSYDYLSNKWNEVPYIVCRTGIEATDAFNTMHYDSKRCLDKNMDFCNWVSHITPKYMENGYLIFDFFNGNCTSISIDIKN